MASVSKAMPQNKIIEILAKFRVTYGLFVPVPRALDIFPLDVQASMMRPVVKRKTLNVEKI
jgi:hypothetical protein